MVIFFERQNCGLVTYKFMWCVVML